MPSLFDSQYILAQGQADGFWTVMSALSDGYSVFPGPRSHAANTNSNSNRNLFYIFVITLTWQVPRKEVDKKFITSEPEALCP